PPTVAPTQEETDRRPDTDTDTAVPVPAPRSNRPRSDHSDHQENVASRDDRPRPAATAEADALYSRGALVSPAGRNAATAYVRILATAPDNAAARAKLNEIVRRVAADSQDLIQRQQFGAARQMVERLGAAIPSNARQYVGADAAKRWHVVDLLLRA